jgi:propanol-preferring alcohol dehydrogenase
MHTYGEPTLPKLPATGLYLRWRLQRIRPSRRRISGENSGRGIEGLEGIAPLFCAGITVWDAIKKGHGKKGDYLAVVGVGGLGHLLVQLACAIGYKVLAIDIHSHQLEIARRLGVTAVIEAREGGATLTKRVLEVTDGKGPHVVCVTSASIRAYETTLDYLRYGGTLVCVGSSPGLTFPLEPWKLFVEANQITFAKVPNAQEAKECIDFCNDHGIKAQVTSFRIEEVESMIELMDKESFGGRLVLSFDS